MAGQLGLQGLAVPAEFGGAGYGPVELGIVLEELGRALVPTPFFSTVALAGQALTASGAPPRDRRGRGLAAERNEDVRGRRGVGRPRPRRRAGRRRPGPVRRREGC